MAVPPGGVNVLGSNLAVKQRNLANYSHHLAVKRNVGTARRGTRFRVKFGRKTRNFAEYNHHWR